MRFPTFVAAAACLCACADTSARLDRTWERFEERQAEVMEHADAAWRVDAMNGTAIDVTQSPPYRVVLLRTYASLCYLDEDLDGLELALQHLEACDRELAAR